VLLGLVFCFGVGGVGVGRVLVVGGAGLFRGLGLGVYFGGGGGSLGVGGWGVRTFASLFRPCFDRTLSTFLPADQTEGLYISRVLFSGPGRGRTLGVKDRSSKTFPSPSSAKPTTSLGKRNGERGVFRKRVTGFRLQGKGRARRVENGVGRKTSTTRR